MNCTELLLFIVVYHWIYHIIIGINPFLIGFIIYAVNYI